MLVGGEQMYHLYCWKWQYNLLLMYQQLVVSPMQGDLSEPSQKNNNQYFP